MERWRTLFCFFFLYKNSYLIFILLMWSGGFRRSKQFICPCLQNLILKDVDFTNGFIMLLPKAYKYAILLLLYQYHYTGQLQIEWYHKTIHSVTSMTQKLQKQQKKKRSERFETQTPNRLIICLQKWHQDSYKMFSPYNSSSSLKLYSFNKTFHKLSRAELSTQAT